MLVGDVGRREKVVIFGKFRDVSQRMPSKDFKSLKLVGPGTTFSSIRKNSIRCYGD